MYLLLKIFLLLVKIFWGSPLMVTQNSHCTISTVVGQQFGRNWIIFCNLQFLQLRKYWNGTGIIILLSTPHSIWLSIGYRIDFVQLEIDWVFNPKPMIAAVYMQWAFRRTHWPSANDIESMVKVKTMLRFYSYDNSAGTKTLCRTKESYIA